MDFSEKYISKLVKFIFVGLSILLLILLLSIPFGKKMKKEKYLLVYETMEVVNSSQILPISTSKVVPIVYNLKADLSGLLSDERKEKFISLLLPSILIARDKINKERIRTIDLLAKQNAQIPFQPKDSLFLLELYSIYDTQDLEKIIDGQQTHPVSIVIAQAALETGWGQSRFFREGNNAFGIWSYSQLDERMTTLSKREGVKIYLRKYDGMLESVMDYYRTIAKSWAFEEFVKKRKNSTNPFELIWYLHMYSETRYDYVQKLGELIVANELTKFDSCTINEDYFISVVVDK